MLARLKLLTHLRAVDLSPAEAGALRDRVKTPTSSAKDHERFAGRIRVTTSVLDHLRTAP
jgi:hypothetical protein